MSENAAEEMSSAEDMPGQTIGADEPGVAFVPEVAHPTSIGARLGEHREALGWTIEQVAQQLNLAPRQIQALEADDHVALPGMASVRGFIRSYSKLLKIDPEPLLKMISESAVTINEPITMRPALSAPFFDDSRLLSRGGRGRSSIPMLVALVLAVAVGGLYGAKKLGWIPALQDAAVAAASAKKAKVPESADTVVQPPEAAVASPIAESDGPVQAVSSSTPPVASTPAAPAASVTTAPAAVAQPVPASAAGTPNLQTTTANKVAGAVVLPATLPAPAASAPAPASPSAVGGPLAFNFRQASWVEIRRVIPKPGSPNNLLVYRLFPAGSTASFDMIEPVTLTIGNAAGVDVSWRGQPLALDNEKSNVVRTTLK